jgi:hypothetical protein
MQRLKMPSSAGSRMGEGVPWSAAAASFTSAATPTRVSQEKAGVVLQVGDGVEEMPARFLDAQIVEHLEDAEIARLVAGEVQVGRAQQEALVALVAAPVDEGGGLGIGARHHDAGHAHDVELEARGVQALDLLVLGHQHLSSLVTALLDAGLLVLDVVAGDPRLHEATDQVPHVGVPAVPGVGVGDDEGPVVHDGSGRALLLAHARAGEVLVPVRGQERTHDGCGLVGHLAQGVARQVRPRILGARALGRRGPASQVDALDAQALHGHGLSRRVGAEGGDLLALGEELPEPRVELLGRGPRHRVVGGDRPSLLRHLARGVEAYDPLEPGAREPPGDLVHLALERAHGLAHRPSPAATKSSFP